MSTENPDGSKDGDIKVAGTKLSGLHEGIEGDPDVLGFASLFTIGEFLEVPMAFVQSQAEEVGLDEEWLPTHPTPKKSFTRACSRLFYDVNNDIGGRFGKYEVETKKAQDTRGLWIVRAEWWDEDIDDFQSKAIGQLEYDYDAKTITSTQRTTDEDLVDVWDEVRSMAYRKFDDMQETWIGSDLRSMVRDVIDSQYSVKLRSAGAVYFVPANQSEELRKVAKVVDSCNAFKKAGRPRAAVGLIEVIDAEDKRDLVAGRVQSELNEDLEKALNNAVDKWEESDSVGEEVEAEIEQLIEGTLDDVLDVAEQYNALLRAEMGIDSIVENLKQNIRQEVEEIVDETLEEYKEEGKFD